MPLASGLGAAPIPKWLTPHRGHKKPRPGLPNGDITARGSVQNPQLSNSTKWTTQCQLLAALPTFVLQSPNVAVATPPPFPSPQRTAQPTAGLFPHSPPETTSGRIRISFPITDQNAARVPMGATPGVHRLIQPLSEPTVPPHAGADEKTQAPTPYNKGGNTKDRTQTQNASVTPDDKAALRQVQIFGQKT